MAVDEQRKDELIATVAHELRTPLTSIRSFSEILRDHPDLGVEQRGELLGIVIAESERLTRLIDDLLDLSKIRSGSAAWELADVPLAAVVGHAASSVAGLFAEQGVELHTSLPPHGPTVRADRDRVVQVLLNLLSNAVKFCDPARGVVDVAVRREDGHARVDVRDNGPGVPRPARERIFQRFDQGVDTVTDSARGTGLGLAISREIIDHLGGRLWLEDVEQGACFSFTLPLAGGGG